MGKQRTANAATEREPSAVVAFGRLLRIALFPSAIADVVSGIAIGYAGAFPSSLGPWLLVPASLGIYHGAMALNDWADRHEDAAARPDRPIPSGAIKPGLALLIAVMLLAGGLMWAVGGGARAGLWMAVVATLAVLYDVRGRGPVLGPLLLGCCRGGNLAAGILAPFLVDSLRVLPDTEAGESWPSPALLALPLVYGCHVFFIGRLGRLEDEEDQEPLAERPTTALRGAGVTALLVPVAAMVTLGATHVGNGAALPFYAGLVVCAALAAWNGSVLLARAKAGSAAGWTRGAVEAATGLCLRRLSLFTSSIALSAMFLGPLAVVAAAAAFGGSIVTKSMRRIFPVT